MSPFAITAPAQNVQLDSGGRGEISFTVSNSTGRPLRGQAKAKALDSTRQEWLSIVGETERDFSPNATQQIAVQVAIPPGTPPGRYTFGLDVASANKPDEDYTEGPLVSAEVKAEKPARPFRWWIPVAIVVVLAIAAVAVWMIISKESSPQRPSQVTGGAFQGQWVNKNAGVNHLLKLIIEQKGSGLTVQYSFKCPEGECNVGGTSGSVDSESTARVGWRDGPMTLRLTGPNVLSVRIQSSEYRLEK